MEKAPDTRTVFLIYQGRVRDDHTVFDADLFDGCAGVEKKYPPGYSVPPSDWRDYEPIALVTGPAGLRWNDDRQQWLYHDDKKVPATAADIICSSVSSVRFWPLESFYKKEHEAMLHETPRRLN